MNANIVILGENQIEAFGKLVTQDAEGRWITEEMFTDSEAKQTKEFIASLE